MKLTDIGEFGFIDRVAEGCLTGERSARGARHRRRRGGGPLPARPAPRHHRPAHRTGALPALGDQPSSARPQGPRRQPVGHRGHGGTPSDAFISIAIPVEVPVEELDGIYDASSPSPAAPASTSWAATPPAP